MDEEDFHRIDLGCGFSYLRSQPVRPCSAICTQLRSSSISAFFDPDPSDEVSGVENGTLSL